MIDALQASRTATFFVLSHAPTGADVETMFDALRAAQQNAQPDLFRHVRVAEGDAHWSAIAFNYERRPAFLPEQDAIWEVVCGFLLIVEHDGHVAVFRSRLDLTSLFRTNHLTKLSPERVNMAIARPDAVFEKVRLKHMTLSRQALRAKTLESSDLSNAVGAASSSRYIAQGYALRSGAGHYAATPSTGRIAQRADRARHLELVDYAVAVIDELQTASTAPSAFIQSFARPISFSELGSTQPTAFAVDTAALSDAIYELEEIRLVRLAGSDWLPLTFGETQALLAELDVVMEVHGDEPTRLLRNATGVQLGRMRLNKAHIALRNLSLPICAGVEVERSDLPLGGDPERIGLCAYLDRERHFIVLFDDVSLAYIDGELYQDGGLAQGSTQLLSYLKAEPSLANVTSEKGTFSAAHTNFDVDSTFSAVAAHVSQGDNVLVCDDLGDEWADFIGLDNAGSPKRITFYHAKHGALSLGASPFHISISQAIKNLGRMSLPSDELPGKVAGWGQFYSNDGAVTQISRTVRSTHAALSDEFNAARAAPDAIRRVMIVTSSLSRQQVEQALQAVAAGQRPSPYFVQLYWLLMSFFSACSEVNAHGYVVCRP
jgi:hypothetical protein